MDVLSAASGIAGLISLSLQLFDGCVKGFVLLSAAQGLGSRAEITNCQLSWEHYHLHCWAHLVGLLNQPPELNVPNIPLVEQTLRNLEQILSNADKLQDNYGLKLTVTDEEVKEVQTAKRLFSGFLNPTARNFVNDTAKVYQRRNSSWKKLKWAAFDQRKFADLIQDVHFFNDQLRSTLHLVEQGQYSGNSNETLRDIVAHTTDKVLLDIVTQKLQSLDSAIKASARLKQKGMLLDILEVPGKCPGLASTNFANRSNHLSPPSSPLRRNSPTREGTNTSLQVNSELIHRNPGAVLQASPYEIATYNDRHVILEWKAVATHMERRLKHRIAAVAEFLAEMNDPSFHSLACIGYMKGLKSSYYAYIFQPPLSGSYSMSNLNDLLIQGSLKPSINQRLVVAVALSETILQLHTAGWLHKSIRSDNVLLFQEGDDAFSYSEMVPAAYLGGYEFARADNVLETTEAPSSHEPSRLYRHPLSLSQDRVPFCKAFDLYSLGCVLLEIGLWRPLHTMIASWAKRDSGDSAYRLPAYGEASYPVSSSDWHLVFQEKEAFLQSAQDGHIANELRFHMGEVYTRVIQRCLNAASSIDGEHHEDEDSLEIQKESLQSLQSVVERI